MEQGQLSTEDMSRIIEMAWEDDIPFEAIQAQYGLKEQQVIELMRSQLKSSSFKMWRKRVTGRKTKHSKRKKQL
ncbi:MAG: TIGR03643 family protein [Halothece sp. Uz-M2-17]|nr:TIGR03643 family protein [Halothece sp. Uz-M2-17]